MLSLEIRWRWLDLSEILLIVTAAESFSKTPNSPPLVWDRAHKQIIWVKLLSELGSRKLTPRSAGLIPYTQRFEPWLVSLLAPLDALSTA